MRDVFRQDADLRLADVGDDTMRQPTIADNRVTALAAQLQAVRAAAEAQGILAALCE